MREQLGCFLDRFIPVDWLLLHDDSWRHRLAIWAAVQVFIAGEREAAPLFWWFHERTLFNGFYIDTFHWEEATDAR